MGKKKIVGRNVALGLGVAIIIVVLVVVLFTFGFIPTGNGSKGAGKLTANIQTSDEGGGVWFSGSVTNVGNGTVYNSKLHIVGIYLNGTQALNTYVTIGNQGVITANTTVTVSPGFFTYPYTAYTGTPIWTVTPEWSNSP